MEYIIIVICILIVAIICTTAFMKIKSDTSDKRSADEHTVLAENTDKNDESQEIIIRVETLPDEIIPDKTKLVEIVDSKVLARINNLIPGLAQAGIATNNIVKNVQSSGEVLYRAVIPNGVRLANSKAMEDAFRGIYHGAEGIRGNANLVVAESQKGGSVAANVATTAMSVNSLVVGQYYMAQINSELETISEGDIKDF